MRRIFLAVAILSLAISPVGPAGAAGRVSLAAHHATYDLTLERARGQVSAATGTMSFEVLDACSGWATRQRLVLAITNGEGRTVNTVSESTTWESKDGRLLRFRTREVSAGSPPLTISGVAHRSRSGRAGSVLYTLPAKREVALPPGTLFPLAHPRAIRRAAASGQRFTPVPLFDGTGPDGAEATFITVVRPMGVGRPGWPALRRMPSTRVHIAFFPRKADTMTPDFESGMRYYVNGVAEKLDLDFGDFVMHGRLVRFALAPPEKCPG